MTGFRTTSINSLRWLSRTQYSSFHPDVADAAQHRQHGILGIGRIGHREFAQVEPTVLALDCARVATAGAKTDVFSLKRWLGLSQGGVRLGGRLVVRSLGLYGGFDRTGAGFPNL